MSAFATYIFATHTHNDTPAKCLLETKIRICDKKEFKIMKTIPDIPFELMNMILCETEKSWRKDHEKKFDEVMTQFTQIRVATLVDVVDGFGEEVDEEFLDDACYYKFERDWLERLDEERPKDEWFYRPVDVIYYIRDWLEGNREGQGGNCVHYETIGDESPSDWFDGLDNLKKNVMMSHTGLNELFLFGYRS